MQFYLLANTYHSAEDGEAIPAGAVSVPRLPLDGETWNGSAFVWDMAFLKQAKRAAVKALRSRKEQATCLTPSGTVQIDDSSKIKINGLATLAQIAKAAAQPFAVDFILADNSVAALNADSAIAMSVAVGNYIGALYANSVALFVQIDAATDKAALDAIDLNAGWP